ncbi:MAG: hypothetical protein IPK03_14580, partial [Bacteroidetes bacterium]|nr:hypothetical protein [Bacteroidota bacterium]
MLNTKLLGLSQNLGREAQMDYSNLFEKVLEKLLLSMIGHAWFGMKAHYERQYPAYPHVPHLDVENINSDEVIEFTKKLVPDMILVSGTRLVKEKLLSVPVGIGILNLHTGLSPYVKGGP